MNSIKMTARIVGFLYFMYFATSIIANMFGSFILVDDLVKVNNIMANE